MSERSEQEITQVLREIEGILIEKNRAYGDSALEPVRIFSRASTIEQINVRLDDKLSRLARGDESAFGENVDVDIIGYLVLRIIAKRRAAG